MPGTQLVHRLKFFPAYIGTPSSASPAYVSLKNWSHITFLVSVLNGSTVTGSAITLKQATDVAATGTKALAFTKAYRNIDLAATDTVTEFAVSSNTFTTDTTNSKRLLYVIEVDASRLDLDNDFDCVAIGLGNAANTTVSVSYILSGGRDSGDILVQPSAIVD